MRRTSLAFAALVAFGVACGSAWAANATVDAAGQGPDMDQMTTTAHDPLTRAEVEQGAVQAPPVAGKASVIDPPATTNDPLTHAQVEQAVDQSTAQDHGFPDASGMQDPGKVQ